MSHLANGLKEPEKYYVVGEIARVDRAFRHAHQPCLAHYQQRKHSLLIEVRGQLVKLHDQELLAGHGVQIAVETVEYEQANLLHFHRAPHDLNEMSRGKFSRVDLLDYQTPLANERFEVHCQTRGTDEVALYYLIKSEDGRTFALIHGVERKLRGNGRLPRPGWTD